MGEKREDKISILLVVPSNSGLTAVKQPIWQWGEYSPRGIVNRVNVLVKSRPFRVSQCPRGLVSAAHVDIHGRLRVGVGNKFVDPRMGAIVQIFAVPAAGDGRT